MTKSLGKGGGQGAGGGGQGARGRERGARGRGQGAGFGSTVSQVGIR